MGQTIQLTKPVEFMGEKLNSITLREPEFGDFIALDEFASDAEFSRLGKMVERLSGLSPATVKALSPVDMFQRIKPAVDAFLLGGQPTTGS